MATTKIIPGVLDLNSATSDKGLKMPSGNVTNRPTEVLGQIRNNTSETSNGSASQMEYYNGTDWKAITVAPFQMDFMVVAGGGSGGFSSSTWNGAGGGGGLRTSYGSLSGGGSFPEGKVILNAGTYTVTVGAGGFSNSGAVSENGNNSSIAGPFLSTITSTGGGGGGCVLTSPAGTGRSGGSGGGGVQSRLGASGTANQGFSGGSTNNNSAAGGGGGAGAAGANSTSTSAGGAGGDGLQVSISGTATYYAGGAGGYNNAAPGLGGGGRTSSRQGGVNTGGGGAGGPGSADVSGGSGIVILRLLTSEYSGTTTGSPTVTTDGADTILTFTGSGTYVH